MNRYSEKVPEQPQVWQVTCDGCGELFLESIVAIVQSIHGGTQKDLLCIECDPAAEERPSIKVVKA